MPRYVTILRLPLLFDVDLVVFGAGLAGLPIAHYFAERGKSVFLVVSLTFLGWEMTSSNALGC
jgi:glycine/D-amino acid oxidase-like deaminating enzyme